MKEIKLTRGKVALVDDQDYEWLNAFKWEAYENPFGKQTRWYAIRRIYTPRPRFATTERMHRLILQPPWYLGVDHKNGNGLDNRRENLRIATDSQNQWNSRKGPGTSSRYKGVSWNKQRKRWAARIWVNGIYQHLGYYEDEAVAALEYDRVAREFRGEFARLNFPEPGEQSALG